MSQNIQDSLLEVVKREKEVAELTKVNPSIYHDVANFIKNLSSRNHDNNRTILNKLSQAKRNLTLSLVDLLLKIRVQKIIKNLSNGQSPESITTLLTEEERFIAEPIFEYITRIKRVKSTISNGQPAFLKRMTKQLSSKYILVRCYKNSPSIMGSDLMTYGPFKQEDIVVLPRENSEALITLGIVKPIQVEG